MSVLFQVSCGDMPLHSLIYCFALVNLSFTTRSQPRTLSTQKGRANIIFFPYVIKKFLDCDCNIFWLFVLVNGEMSSRYSFSSYSILSGDIKLLPICPFNVTNISLKFIYVKFLFFLYLFIFTIQIFWRFIDIKMYK